MSVSVRLGDDDEKVTAFDLGRLGNRHAANGSGLRAGDSGSLHTATLAALNRGDPMEMEDETYRHLGHFEGIVIDVLQRTRNRHMPAFLLACTH